MKPLDAAERANRLASLPGWSERDGAIERTFRFPGFLAAIRFVDRIALTAEEANHHPDIDVRYDRVRLALATHDAGGITVRDFDLAARADALAVEG